MKKICYTTLISLLALGACQTPPSTPNGVPSDTTPRAQSTQSDAQTSTQTLTTNNNVIINNNSAELQSRIHPKNRAVSISNFSTQNNDLQLTLVAEVDPPSVQGQSVQATNVSIQGNYAYVSYDVAGPEFSGGVYIIDISNPSEPRLMSELLRSDLDYYDVRVEGNTLLLPGAEKGNGAAMGVVELMNGGAGFAGEKTLINLPSFAATDVDTHNGSAYVTVGDQGGGVVKLSLDNYERQGFYNFEDARGIDEYYSDRVDDAPGDFDDGTLLGVFAGTPGRLALITPDLEEVASYSYSNAATIPVSKSTIDITGQFAYLGAGDGGTKVVDLFTGRSVNQYRSENGITNGMAVTDNRDEGYGFMAQGEDGVAVAHTNRNTGALDVMGTLDLEGSSNMVAYQNNVLFVANGNGGLSILTVQETAAPQTVPRYQSVFVRQFDNQRENGFLSVFKGTITLTGDVKVAGVVFDTNSNVPNLRASDQVFASRISEDLPQRLDQARVRHFESQNPDYARVIDDKTVEFSTGITNGADDFRLILDYGENAVASDTSMTITLDTDTSTGTGIIIGEDKQENATRTATLSTAQGIVIDSDATIRTPSEDRDLIVLREGGTDEMDGSFQVRR